MLVRIEPLRPYADISQLAESLFCTQDVGRSIRPVGSKSNYRFKTSRARATLNSLICPISVSVQHVCLPNRRDELESRMGLHVTIVNWFNTSGEKLKLRIIRLQDKSGYSLVVLGMRSWFDSNKWR